MGKAWVAPLKTVTIPRLELIAALVSINVGLTIRRELDYEKVAEVFWTDSQVVLGYIKNNDTTQNAFTSSWPIGYSRLEITAPLSSGDTSVVK